MLCHSTSDGRLCNTEGTPLPTYQTFEADTVQRGGAKGTFTVNDSDLVTGNTILISTIAQDTTDPAGNKVTFFQHGSYMPLNTGSGTTVGNLHFADTAAWGPAIVLDVTNTLGGVGTITFQFEANLLFLLNYATSASVMHNMPFDATFTTGKNQAGAVQHAYTIHFNAPAPTYDATMLGGDYLFDYTAEGIRPSEQLRHTRIADDTQFLTLQNTNGAAGVPDQGSDFIRSYHLTADQPLMPDRAWMHLGTFYVSAATHKVQSYPNSLYAAAPEVNAVSIPINNAGNNLTLAQTQQSAQAQNTSNVSFSTQADGSYLVVTYVKYTETILTDAQIEDSTRSTLYANVAANSVNIDADVQATLDYYHGVLHNSATHVYPYANFSVTDPYKVAHATTQLLDNNSGTVLQSTTDSTAQTSIASSGQTMVKSHYLDINGQSMSQVTATAGNPTGKANSVTGEKGTASAPATPANVAGYRPLTVADLGSLTAAQRQTIASTLGTTDSSVAGLTALANKNNGKTVWATGNVTVPYPGETGKTYNVNGDIVAAGTAGSNTGWGTTDVYYFYTLATQKLNVHVVQVPCYANSADATSGKDCDATPGNGSSWQPSDGTENTGLGETFTGLSGTPATSTLAKYTVQLGGKDHPASLSAGLQQLAPGTDSKRTINFQLNTTYDMDNNTDQDEYVYVQANPEKDITKTTTRTIHYKLNHNTVDTPPADNVQTITWTQHQIHNTAYDSIDGTANWSKYVWQASSSNTPATTMPKINSPVINGYIAKTPVVSEITGIQHNGATDNSSTTFAPTDPANPDTSDRSLTVTVVYNKTVQRMPFTGGSGVLLGTLIALALLAMAAILTHLRNKRANK